MSLKELRNLYSSGELRMVPGDAAVRYKILSPFLHNLHENKVVYFEKFLCIVRLENIQITPDRFHATAVPYLDIKRETFLPVFRPTEPWDFGAVWEGIALNQSAITASYVGWRIWPEPDKVKAVESLARNGDHQQALELTVNERE